MKNSDKTNRTRTFGILSAVAGIFLFGAQGLAQSGTALPAAGIELPNIGGDMGGHTPWGFRGQGDGIFLGDNLNSRFPNNDGVQAFISFDLSAVATKTIVEATLSSPFLRVNGSPFADLGTIRLERVRFDKFSSAVWDITTEADAGCVLSISPDLKTAGCDLSEVVQNAVAQGDQLLQFRLRFEKIGDGDGRADLAQFFKRDSNTNEGGVFILTAR